MLNDDGVLAGLQEVPLRKGGPRSGQRGRLVHSAGGPARKTPYRATWRPFPLVPRNPRGLPGGPQRGARGRRGWRLRRPDHRAQLVATTANRLGDAAGSSAGYTIPLTSEDAFSQPAHHGRPCLGSGLFVVDQLVGIQQPVSEAPADQSALPYLVEADDLRAR